MTESRELRFCRALLSITTNHIRIDHSWIIKVLEHEDMIELFLRGRLNGDPKSIQITKDWIVSANISPGKIFQLSRYDKSAMSNLSLVIPDNHMIIEIFLSIGFTNFSLI